MNNKKIDMDNKFSYIRRASKYIIGTVILATSLSSAAFGLNKDDDGYYKIGNAFDLKVFLQLVNHGDEPNAKGKIMCDIEFNGDSVINDGELKVLNFEKWSSIGTYKEPFEGELISCDGETKKIKGIYLKKGKRNGNGLFGVIGKEGKVRDIELINSYIEGRDCVGGIAGINYGEVSDCVVSNSIIRGSSCVGGNVGWNNGAMSGNCINEGTVNGKNEVGGNIGYNDGIIKGKCKNKGVIIGEQNDIGGNVGYNNKKILGNCSNSGFVKGDTYIGVKIGYNSGNILGKCVNKGQIEGKNGVGKNIGWSWI